MIGLLYKDFIATKGKILLGAGLIQFILIAIMRFVFKNDIEAEIMIIYLFSGCMFLLFGFIIFFLNISLLKSDNEKQVTYYLSTPVKRSDYVTSKYLYLFITYAFISVIIVLEVLIVKTDLISTDAQKIMNNLWKIMPILIGVFMICTAVELPFYFGLGVDRGKNVKEGLIIILLFIMVAYLFFGDLSVLDNFNLSKLLDLLIKNKNLLQIMQIATPLAAIGLFGVSYFVSARCMNCGLTV